jgi:hypothetical protein
MRIDVSYNNYEDFGTVTTSTVQWKSRVIVMTDTHTDRQTYTHTQTHGHQFFYCFIVFRDLKNVQKKHKKWVYKIFIFRMNSILRHSNASRSNMFEPCDVICHVTVAFYIYHFIGALTLYMWHIIRRQLQHLYAKKSTKISKKLEKFQNRLKMTFLSRTSRNWCTDPIHVIHT